MLNLNSPIPDNSGPKLCRHPGRSSEPGSIEALGLHEKQNCQDGSHDFRPHEQTVPMDPGLHGNRGDGSIQLCPPLH